MHLRTWNNTNTKQVSQLNAGSLLRQQTTAASSPSSPSSSSSSRPTSYLRCYRHKKEHRIFPRPYPDTRPPGDAHQFHCAFHIQEERNGVRGSFAKSNANNVRGDAWRALSWRPLRLSQTLQGPFWTACLTATRLQTEGPEQERNRMDRTAAHHSHTDSLLVQ